MSVRNLLRHPRRTLLSVAGIAFGVAIAVVFDAYMRGVSDFMVRTAAESGVGHWRVVPSGWREEHDDSLRLASGAETLQRIRAVPGVRVAAPRARTEGLLGMGARVAAVELVGVDPAAEVGANRMLRNVTHGRWLEAGERGAIVLGEATAKSLRAGVGDELVVTVAAAGGEIGSELLVITGIVTTGSDEADAGIAHVPLADVETLTRLSGFGEIGVLLDDAETIPLSGEAIARLLPPEDTLLSWEELAPDLAADRRIDAGTQMFMTATVILVVLLGVAGAQLTAVLERRREFAVLLAIGMKGRTLARQLVLECTLVAAAGAASALALAIYPVHHLATEGLDLAVFLGNDGFSFGGIVFDTVIKAPLGWWIVWEASWIALLASWIATAYPLWFALRTDPADALRTA